MTKNKEGGSIEHWGRGINYGGNREEKRRDRDKGKRVGGGSRRLIDGKEGRRRGVLTAEYYVLTAFLTYKTGQTRYQENYHFLLWSVISFSSYTKCAAKLVSGQPLAWVSVWVWG